MKIAIDAMGGDHAPKSVIEGAITALLSIDSDIVLYGDSNVLEKALLSHHYDSERLSIVHCSDTILSDDQPVKAVKQKSDASMVRGIVDLKKNLVDVFISAGNTGALLAASSLKIGRIKGIKRPALTIGFPTNKGLAILADAGANTECDPLYLQQFAIMSHLYAKHVIGIEEPKCGLVNVGSEAGKGNALYKAAYERLENTAILDFYGNLEARDIPAGVVDVIVCDGFTGNVILKLTEGVASNFGKALKHAIIQSPLSKIGGLLIKKGLDDFKQKMDYTEYGGAPLLGLKKPVVKAHGSSNAKAIMNAIRYAEKYAKQGIIEKITQYQLGQHV